MTPGLVSVITPFFNADPFLGEAIESVLAQSYAPLELLLVDDGSSDGSPMTAARAATEHENIRLLRLAHNQGPAFARNFAVREAVGEFVTFLDADDAMVPDRLAFQVEYLSTHSEADVVIGLADYVVEPGVDPPPWFDRPGSRLQNPMTMLATRAVFDLVGLFDPTYRVGEDTEWMFRAASAGVTVTRVDKVLIRRRLHGGNLTYGHDALREAFHSTILSAVRAQLSDPRSQSD